MAKVEVSIEALDGFVRAGLEAQLRMQLEYIKDDARKFAETGREVHIANILDHAATYRELRSILEYYGG